MDSPFKIVLLSDTQYVVEAFPQDFVTQTQWIADNAAAQNIAFVTHQGDLLRRGYSDYQVSNADAALDRLDGVVPYSVSIGNHDYDNQFDDLDHHISSAKFVGAFGPGRYSQTAGSAFRGASLDGRNHYHVFSAGGREFMLLSVEWEAPDSAIAWAQGVINSHRHIPVILSTHEYFRTTGRTTSPLDNTQKPGGGNLFNAGEQIYQKLVRPNPQIFMVVNGHTGGEAHQTSLNNAGSGVFEIIADYSGRANGGDGWFQMLEFNPATGSINATTYSPKLNQSETDANSQYSLPIDFASRFSFAAAGVPIANDDVREVSPGGSVNLDVRANDFEPDGEALIASIVSQAANGTLTVEEDGSYTYTPAAGFSGTDSFRYTFSDGAGTSNEATVTLQVNGAPVAQDDLVETPESRAVTFNPVANDDDGEGNALRAILATLPEKGAVFVNADGSFTYTPDPKFVGIDTFSYVVSDGTANGNVATVSVNVASKPPIYDYPIAEMTVFGTRTGTFAATHASDEGAEEIIREVLRNGVSDLEHRWQFNVTGGAGVTFAIKAKRSWGPDEFHLQYSTNGGTIWSDMQQIVPASSRDVTRVLYDSDQPYQMWNLPAATRGNVWVRVTDVGPADTTLDTFTVDEVFIRSGRDEQAPTAPSNLAVTATTGTTASLAWTAAADNVAVVAYDVYRDGAKVGETAGTVFTDSGLAPLTSYNYHVIARDAAGNVSPQSNTVTATTKARVAAPSNLVASVQSKRRVRLTWRDNANNESGFYVYSSRDGINFTRMTTVSALSGTGGTRSFTTGTLASGRWYFRVTAFDAGGESEPSNVVSVLL